MASDDSVSSGDTEVLALVLKPKDKAGGDRVRRGGKDDGRLPKFCCLTAVSSYLKKMQAGAKVSRGWG